MARPQTVVYNIFQSKYEVLHMHLYNNSFLTPRHPDHVSCIHCLTALYHSPLMPLVDTGEIAPICPKGQQRLHPVKIVEGESRMKTYNKRMHSLMSGQSFKWVSVGTFFLSQCILDAS